MARQPKTTLDYITIDCVDKTTLKRLHRKFKAPGRLFWYELLRLLGRSDGYLIDLSNDWSLEDVLEEELFVSKELGIEILDALSDWGNIDSDTWKTHKIIWCQGLIDRHSDLWRKRKKTPSNPFKSNGNNTTTVQKHTTAVPNNTTTDIKVAVIPQSKVK
ncbi:Lin1244/Lin1753 domain-containing protein [Flavicella sp.]|uniref:Lin1244/Lin1753 domain-containing protein n=1 Tax=Flavicella sp. TaxID=2957742 RepID=UPI003015AC25